MKQLFRYGKTFGGFDPILKEESVFQVRLAIPILGSIPVDSTAQAERWEQVLDFCQTPRTRTEIQIFLGLKHREHLRHDILQPLIIQGQLQLTLSDKPQNSRQRYVAV